MGACYGPGILGHVPGGVEGEQAQIAFCEQFASFGISHGFREVIGDRVAEFSYRKGAVDFRWLDDDDARPILSTWNSYGGSAPYSMLEAFWPEDQIWLPGFRGRWGFSLKVEGHPYDGMSVAPLRNAIASAEECIAHYQNLGPSEHGYDDREMSTEMCQMLLRDFQYCREQRLIFMFGY